MEDNKLKKEIINTIGNHIDEVCLVGDPNSFIEMETNVLHCIANGEDYYFALKIERVSEENYFDKYEP
ncbi:MAG: hypothetical protein GY861_12560 [bacterium]|nr:hypothetical protein [bacterium]